MTRRRRRNPREIDPSTGVPGRVPSRGGEPEDLSEDELRERGTLFSVQRGSDSRGGEAFDLKMAKALGQVPPVGTWRMDPVLGYLEQLQRVPVAELGFTESIEDRGIRASVERYVGYYEAGLEPPPADVVWNEPTQQLVTLNRRRVLAAKQAGVPSILAWVGGDTYEKMRERQGAGARRNPEGTAPDVTRTKEFRRWFGDSKVVDAQGRPLVVWHGSPRNVDPFYVFDFDRAIDLGMHFGTPAAAFDVIGTTSSYAMHPTSPLWRHVRPFYLALQHPVFLSDPGDWISQPYGSVAVPTLDQLFSRGIIDEEQYQQAYEKVIAVREGPRKEQDLNQRRVLISAIVRDAIIDAGYDGVKYTNENEDVGSMSWIAFFPEQIKLADGTNTTFDWKSPDVRFNPRSRLR